MDRDDIDTIAVIARGALEENGYGATFGHDTEEGHQAFYVNDLDSGRILAEIVIKARICRSPDPRNRRSK